MSLTYSKSHRRERQAFGGDFGDTAPVLAEAGKLFEQVASSPLLDADCEPLSVLPAASVDESVEPTSLFAENVAIDGDFL